jgi:hypothetical protein
VPLVAVLVRSTRRLAVALAQRALPGPGGRRLDRAAAPRGALVAALHFAMLLAAAVPLVAVLQPFVPGLPVVGPWSRSASPSASRCGTRRAASTGTRRPAPR